MLSSANQKGLASILWLQALPQPSHHELPVSQSGWGFPRLELDPHGTCMKGCAHVTRKQEHDWDHLFIHIIYIYTYTFAYLQHMHWRWGGHSRRMRILQRILPAIYWRCSDGFSLEKTGTVPKTQWFISTFSRPFLERSKYYTHLYIVAMHMALFVDLHSHTHHVSITS